MRPNTPIRVEQSNSEPPAHSPAAEVGLKILVVDDNRDVADGCAAVLKISGHEIQTAYCGERALELAAQFRPHVVVLDS
jgi:two-component system CheB/CheR fusion protein